MAPRARRTKKPTHDDPRSLRALLVRHLEWMRVQNYAPLTVKTRDFDMRRFFTWCDERGIATAVEITPSVIEDYKRHLFHRKKKDGKPLSRKTQLHLLVSLLGFTKWLLKRGLVLTDPGALIELPQIDRRLPHPALTIEEVEQVLGAIDVTQPLGLRDRTILEMAYSTGMRRIELAHACLEDVDAERGTVYVRRGKGNKDRVVPIGARALSWLDKYLEEVRPFFARDDEVREIFVSRFGTPMTEEALSAVGLKRRRRAGLDKPGSLHIYRHSAATGMLEGGADIRVIQEYLGHAYLTSTQVYTKVAIQTVKAVHARTHPAERPKVDPTDSDEE